MRKIATYILISAGLVAAFSSCRREGNPLDMTLDTIRVETGVSTKAIINSSADLNTDGSQVRVYDVLSGFTGIINNTSYVNEDAVYFAEDLTYGDGAWNFPGVTYRWTRTGTHNFFGWLLYDAKSGMYSASEVNPSYTNDVLTIPTKTITTASDQFDFLYSRNVVVRDAATKDYSTVPLNMAHLFSALALTVENRSNEPVIIKSISIPNLPVMNGGATIDYTPDGRTAPVVTYTGPSTGATQFFTNPINPAGITLSSKNDSNNNKINAFTGARFLPSDTYDYRLLWPVGSDILSPTTANPYQGTPGHRYETSLNNPADSLIRLTYQYTVTPEVGDPYVIERNDIGVKIPSDVAFAPGKKTYINITLNDKVVDLTFVVQEWEVSEYPLEFSSGSVTVTQSFTYVPGTFAEKNGDDYYIDIAQPLVGKFSITNPVGARIQVAPKGDAQYFNVSLNHDIVDPKVDMGEILVSITPNTTYGTPTTAKRLTLDFYVVNGTQEININSEVRFEGAIVWSN